MKALKVVSDIAAVVSILACLLAGFFRLSGSFYVGGFEALTLFNAGMVLMVFACLLKLEVLIRRG